MARLDRIIERLDLKEFQLRALLDVTKAINNNTGREDLLKLYEHSLREEFRDHTTDAIRIHGRCVGAAFWLMERIVESGH